MKILAIESEAEGIVNIDFTPFLREEALQVWKLYKSDIIREIYFSGENEAVIILECENIDKAKEVLTSLPLVKEKIISFRFLELHPYTGFDRLISHVE